MPVAEISSHFKFNEEHLRKSLKTILTYAEEDKELSDTFNSFPEQVRLRSDSLCSPRGHVVGPQLFKNEKLLFRKMISNQRFSN